MDERRSEVRVEARLKNNVLWHAIYDKWPSVAAFSEETGISMTAIHNYVGLRKSPVLKDGQWSRTAERIADALGTLVEDLFPLRLYEMETTRAVVEIPLSALPPSSEELRSLLPAPEDVVAAGELRSTVAEILGTLTEREAAVLRSRFGIGEEPRTLRDIGEDLGVQQERIRQIEAKALRKLRHSSRSKKIIDCIDHEDIPCVNCGHINKVTASAARSKSCSRCGRSIVEKYVPWWQRRIGTEA